MARAKNTSRSEARRRTREEMRAELASTQEPEDGGQPGDAPEGTATVRPRRSGVLFKWPNIPADIRSVVPQFRARPLLWLPFGLVLIGFVLGLIVQGLPVELQQYVGLYFQFFFNPVALFTYFIAGFLAQRASYLFGALAGFFTGLMTILLYVLLGAVAIDPTGQDQTGTLLSGTDLLFASVALIAQTTFIGGAAGGFAGWYRDFLRRMQENSRTRQAQREQEAKAKRAAERQEARRAAKSRPTT